MKITLIWRLLLVTNTKVIPCISWVFQLFTLLHDDKYTFVYKERVITNPII